MEPTLGIIISASSINKMAVREIIEIWSDEGLINENIKFLTKQTKEVDLSRSSNIENIITD